MALIRARALNVDSARSHRNNNNAILHQQQQQRRANFENSQNLLANSDDETSTNHNGRGRQLSGENGSQSMLRVALRRESTVRGLRRPSPVVLLNFNPPIRRCNSFINLNVSGNLPFSINFKIPPNLAGIRYTIPTDGQPLPPSDRSMLHRLAGVKHEVRLSMCSAFFEHTQEYYFARSPPLFEPILAHYLTGHLHVPSHLCKWELRAELDFWCVPSHVTSLCCVKKVAESHEYILKAGPSMQMHLDEATKEGQLQSAFDKVHLGHVRIVAYRLLEQPTSSILARLLATFSVAMILLSFIIMVCASMEEFCPRNKLEVGEFNISVCNDETTHENCPIYLSVVNQICICWFTLELFLRFGVAAKKWRFIRAPLNIIDLIAILPFYVELIVGYTVFYESSDPTPSPSPIPSCNPNHLSQLPKWQVLNQILLSLRTLRVLRVLKLARYSNGLRKFGKVLRKSKMQLLTAGITGVVVVMLSSTMVYYVEKDVPDTQFVNIPISMWWALITMSSVGYGDIVPVTLLGRLIASGTVVVGVMVLALPVSILVQNFTEQLDDEEEAEDRDDRERERMV